jgi:pantoate--beta-alanine ligase
VKTLRQPRAVQRHVENWRQSGLKVGLVPTMGALHDGHMSLLRAARAECDAVIASVFVNPMQFGPKEDFARYPRPVRQDLSMLREAECDLLFQPNPLDMYPDGFQFSVVGGALAETLEGKFRPGHFRGVTTVCLKLFNICKPHVAYFGQKDYQQALLVDRMARDLNLDLMLKVLPTVRDPDGLALSSRNRYLSAGERRIALSIPRVLQSEARALKAGLVTASGAEKRGARELRKVRGLKLDYFAVRAAETLESPGKGQRHMVLLVAARVGKTRLIDNIRVNLNLRKK